MAERVNKNVDRFLKDAEFLQKIGVYEENETKKYIKDIIKLEYGVCKKISVLSDFMKYIQYHISYYNETENRLKEKKVPNTIGILLSHQRRIHFIFRRSLQKFKNCDKMWCLHFKFCLETENFPILESSITNFIRLHFTSDKSWCLAAYWYSFHNIETSRKCFKRSLQLFPDSILLWESFIHFIVSQSVPCTVNLNEIFDTLSSGFLSTNYNLTLFENIYTNLCHSLPEKELLTSLTTYFSCQKLPHNLWFLIIKKQFSYDEDIALKMIEESLEYYKSESAFSCVCEIFQDQNVKITNVMKLSCLLTTVFEKYNSENIFTDEKGYSNIISILIKMGDILKVKQLCDDAMKKYKNSWDIVKQHLQIFYIYFFESHEACSTYFSKMLTAFPSHSISIIKEWSGYIFYYNEVCAFDLALSLFVKKHLNHIGRFILYMFDFIFLKLGYEFIKTLLLKYSANSIIPSELVLKFTNLESIAQNPDDSLISKLFEYQISSSEKDSTEFWLEYIKYEMNKLRRCSSFQNDSIISIYNRAVKTLPKNNIQDFVSKFSVLQTTCI